MITFEKIRSAVAESLCVAPEDIKPESSFIRDLGADSLSLAQLMIDLEVDLGVEIPQDDAAKFFTPQDVVNYFA